MIRIFVLLLALLLSKQIFSQGYFEGDILYKIELEKKKNTFDETSIATYPAKWTKGIYKNGDWLQKPNDGIVEYIYFNRLQNKLYWKLQDIDTLYFELGSLKRDKEGKIIKTHKVKLNKDTILGFVCDELLIETSTSKLTFLFSRSFPINPAWHQNTKLGFYNVIYASSKSMILKSTIETDDYISRMVLHQIRRRKVSDTEFPDLKYRILKKL